MTKTALKIERAYQEIFGTVDYGQRDLVRLGFLESVVTGETTVRNRQVSLENAIDAERAEIAKLDEKARRETRQIERERIATKIEERNGKILVYEAVKDVRGWYLEAETDPAQLAKCRVLPGILEAGLSQVYEAIDDCMHVLRQHRIYSLIQSFDKLLTTGGDEEIARTAKELFQKNVPELTEAVVTGMSRYVSGLKKALDKAVETKDIKAVYMVSDRLFNSGIPELQEYAEKTVNSYLKK